MTSISFTTGSKETDPFFLPVSRHYRLVLPRAYKITERKAQFFFQISGEEPFGNKMSIFDYVTVKWKKCE
jgi:hypothetical protein